MTAWLCGCLLMCASYWPQGTIRTQQEEDLPLTTLNKACNACFSESQMPHETALWLDNQTTANEDKHQTSAVPQNLGHYCGAGWLQSIYKLQQWPAFSVIVVVRLGQSPSNTSLFSHCWIWTSVIQSLNRKMIIIVTVITLKQIYLHV